MSSFLSYFPVFLSPSSRLLIYVEVVGVLEERRDQSSPEHPRYKSVGKRKEKIQSVIVVVLA